MPSISAGCRRRNRRTFEPFWRARSGGLRPVPRHGKSRIAMVESQPASLLLVFALLAVLPLAFMALTAFVKISTVLQIVRGAIGAQHVPSSTVILALSAALTVIAMAPVGSRIWDRAAPLLDGKQDSADVALGVVEAVREPLRDFMRANASE